MEDLESLHEISIVWRGKKFDLQMSPTATLKQLGDEMQKLTDCRADTMRFIVPQVSKLLFPFSNDHERLSLQETSIVTGKPIRMMGVSENEVDEILQGENLNLRIAGFDEEKKRLNRRISNGPQTRKLPPGPYTFGGFRTLQLPGIELNPPESEALKRMHMLASDPGIVAIMNKHRWHVGIMTEMAPEGYVGISAKCILGLNRNKGQEISLRLRTDDLKGFRKYERIKKTLIHELAHMVHDEHDTNFHALNKQLTEEANSLDWTKSTSHTVSGIRHSDYDDEELFAEEEGITVSRKLGGNTSEQLTSARMASVVAAYRRIENALSNSSEVSEVRKDEPDPDEFPFRALDNSTRVDNSEKEKLDADTLDEVDEKRFEEPDPDAAFTNRNEFKPNPDEFQEERTQKTTNEYDPNDLVVKQDVLKSGVDSRPAEENSLSSGKVDHQSQLSTGYEKSDLRGSREDKTMQVEPYPDHEAVQSAEISRMQIDEPDPDDEELRRIRDPVMIACDRLQKAIELLRAEVGPAEAIIVLQTLFKIISNVIEHPNEMKFKKLRKVNPVIQRTIANYKAAMELLVLIGFSEERLLDEKGTTETYLVLKRNDPGFLWLAKSVIETNVVP